MRPRRDGDRGGCLHWQEPQRIADAAARARVGGDDGRERSSVPLTQNRDRGLQACPDPDVSNGALPDAPPSSHPGSSADEPGIPPPPIGVMATDDPSLMSAGTGP